MSVLDNTKVTLLSEEEYFGSYKNEQSKNNY